MNTLLDAASPVLTLVLANAAKASVLACAVALICLLFRRWLSPGWRHVLWCVVFVRLLLPDISVPGWRWNVNSLVPQNLVVMQSDAPSDAPAPAAPLEDRRDVLPPLEDPALTGIVPSAAALTKVPADAGQQAPIVPNLAPSSASQASFNLWQVLMMVWLVGTVAWWTALVVSWWRFKRRVIDPSTPASAQAQALLAECLGIAGIRHRIAVQCSPHVSAPSVCGLFRHVILLPESLEPAISRADLRLLLLHELGHVKRRDSVVHVLASLLLGLHWWNPILWLAWHQLRHEAEAATDAWVLRRTGSNSAPSYGAMLLTLASRACASGVALVLVPTLIRATSRGRRLKQRIVDIASHRATARWAGIVPGFVVLAGIVMTGFSQEAAKKEPSPAPAAAAASGDTIGGIIVDDQDRPIAGAEVAIEVRPARSKFQKSILPSGYKSPAPVKSDAEGRWTMSGVPKGMIPTTIKPEVDSFIIYVAHPEFLYRGIASSDTLTEASFRDGTAKVVLNRGIPISGMVRDESGRPIAGAIVYRNLSVSTSRRGEPSATTDAYGRYELKSNTGELALRVHARGFAAQVKRVTVKEPTDQDFTLKKGHTLKLSVRDDKDQSIEGASVAIFPPGEHWKSHEFLWRMNECPADGHITWNEAPEGKLVVEVKGKYFSRFTTEVTAGEEAKLRLPAANRLTAVTVKVTDADTGTPLSSCLIDTGAMYSSTDNVSWSGLASMVLDFKEGSQPGVYEGVFPEQLQRRAAKFCVRQPGYIPAATARVEPSKGDATLEVALRKAQAVQVTVRSKENAPAAGARIIVAWQTSVHLKEFALSSPYSTAQMDFIGETGADGRCELPPAMADAFVVITHDDGFAIAPYADILRNPVVNLGVYAQVEAVVTQDGKPAPGAKYEFHGGLDSLSMGVTVLQQFEVVSDEQGRIFLPRVLPSRTGRFSPPGRQGSYVTGRIRTYTPATTQRVPGGQVTKFALEAAPSQARTVVGRLVLEGGGIPTPSRATGLISIRLNRRSQLGSDLSIGLGSADEKGGFTFEEVAPGTYYFVITPGVHPKARYVLAGDKTEIEVKVPPLSDDPAGKKIIDLGAIEVVDTQKPQ